MNFEINGKVILKEDTQQINDRFKKENLLLKLKMKETLIGMISLNFS